ncbi:MAG: hypothetical protein IPI64_10905 [Chloracidobacterium sp.]|nr:hypothetical protein [Chloracidobacterium sp.]
MNWSSSKSFITRALPFAATFVVAVFVTSLFVDLNGPRMRGFHGKRHQEMMRLRMENQELRKENFRLQEQLDIQQMGHRDKHPGDEIRLQELNELPPVPVVPRAKR